MNKKKIFLIIALVLLVVLGVNTYFVFRSMRSYNEGNAVYDEIRKEAADESEESGLDFAELKRINPDFVGWLSLNDTVIDYPVVKGQDNDYYLTHLFTGEYNTLGSIFVDFRNNDLFTDKVNVIYGHSMLNGSMFFVLEKYKNQSFYDEHPAFLFQMEDHDYYFYPIAGVIKDAKEPFVEFDFASDQEFYDYIDGFIKRSTFRSAESFVPEDKVVMMIKCSKDFDDARYVLISKVVEVD